MSFQVVVCDDAVVRRTLGLTAFIVATLFFLSIFHRNLLYGRKSVYRNPEEECHRDSCQFHQDEEELSIFGNKLYPLGS